MYYKWFGICCALIIACSASGEERKLLVTTNGIVFYDGYSPYPANTTVTEVAENNIAITSDGYVVNTQLYGSAYIIATDNIFLPAPQRLPYAPDVAFPAGFNAFAPNITNYPASPPVIGEFVRSVEMSNTVVLTTKESINAIYGQGAGGSAISLTREDSEPNPLTLYGDYADFEMLGDASSTVNFIMAWPELNRDFCEPIYFNKTEAWWTGPSAVSVGDTFSIYGRNLMLGGTNSYAYIDGHGWVTNSGGNAYKADFVVPAGLANDTYDVYAHNGWGKEYGWGEALELTVQSATAWDEDTNNWIYVTDPLYGAVGDGVTDDRGAIVSAMQACPAGGTVYFPAGTYAIGSKVEESPSGYRMIGEDRDTTTIMAINNYDLSANEWLVFKWNPDDTIISSLCFSNGPTMTGKLLRGSCTDTVFTNCTFTDYPLSTSDKSINAEGSDGLTFDGCKFVTDQGVWLGNSQNVFIKNCEFRGRGDQVCLALVEISGGKGVSITDSTGQPNDNSDYTDGEGWCLGRFILMNGGTGGTARNVYIGGNNTYDMAPRFNFDEDAYTNQGELNSGEQVLCEHQRAKWRGDVVSATSDTVTLSGLSSDQSGRMITIVDGTGFGQSRYITGYDSGTVTVDKEWGVRPTSGSVASIGVFNQHIVVYGNTFRSPSWVALPVNTENNTTPYDPGSFPRETASTMSSFYGGCSDSIVAGNTGVNVGMGMANYSGLNPIDGVWLSTPNYFNLFLDNYITNCQTVFHTDVFHDEPANDGDPISPVQGDIGIFAVTFRDNTYTNYSEALLYEDDGGFDEIELLEVIYEGNAEGVE